MKDGLDISIFCAFHIVPHRKFTSWIHFDIQCGERTAGDAEFCNQQQAAKKPGKSQANICAICPINGLYLASPTEVCALIKCAGTKRESRLSISELPQKGCFCAERPPCVDFCLQN